MTRPAGHPKEDDAFATFTNLTGRTGCGTMTKQIRKCQSRQTREACFEEIASTEECQTFTFAGEEVGECVLVAVVGAHAG